jgi:hypothetical protein
MLVIHPGQMPVDAITLIVAVLICAGFAHWGPNTSELDHDWHPVPAIAMSVLFVVCVARMVGGEPSKFLYFQF